MIVSFILRTYSLSLSRLELNFQNVLLCSYSLFFSFPFSLLRDSYVGSLLSISPSVFRDVLLRSLLSLFPSLPLSLFQEIPMLVLCCLSPCLSSETCYSDLSSCSPPLFRSLSLWRDPYVGSLLSVSLSFFRDLLLRSLFLLSSSLPLSLF